MHDEAAVFAALRAHQPAAASTPQLTFQEAVRLLSAVPGSPPHQARKLLEDTEQFANSLQLHDVEAVLLYLLSKARGKDYELRRQYTLYYQNSFDMLNCMKKAEMQLTAVERQQLAYKTILCAFLSDSIFNFGKFMQCEELHDALQAAAARHAAAPNMGWAMQWVQQCSEGEVDAFEAYFAQHRAVIEEAIVSFAFGGGARTELQAQQCEEIFASIFKKVRLMALLHLIFYTPIHKCVFTFQQIAERCRIRESDEVELLLLTAMAQGIVRGSMDGLTQTVTLSWVEPRLLGHREVRELAEHMRSWRTHTEAARAQVHEAILEVHAQQQAQI
ncbi:26S proteasome regulatory subunit N9 [Strigomonas culicis]|uniref:26S proteasome regulatory subunit N9 n=1 Tax=Strigomonas culicis TaxID=28005 RepID=S9U6D1_9TRYP|nr:26S proteasome regulatory subunit N9 [Strigomonas culicis]|eukprot:EPY26337.1 26S proteasome regulatory subunit N9 [Strigomonas culicis]